MNYTLKRRDAGRINVTAMKFIFYNSSIPIKYNFIHMLVKNLVQSVYKHFGNTEKHGIIRYDLCIQLEFILTKRIIDSNGVSAIYSLPSINEIMYIIHEDYFHAHCSI